MNRKKRAKLYSPPADPPRPQLRPCPSCGTDHDATTSLCPIRCPQCGYFGDIDTFDVLGAEDGKLWCNKCGAEVDNDKHSLHGTAAK